MNDLDQINHDIKYLIRTTICLVEACQENNKGLHEMNTLIKGLVRVIVEDRIMRNEE